MRGKYFNILQKSLKDIRPTEVNESSGTEITPSPTIRDSGLGCIKRKRGRSK